MIQSLEQQGSISQHAKVTATVLLIGLFSLSFLLLDFSLLFKSALVCTGAGVLGFIWTRPLPLRHLDEFGNSPADAREDLVRLGRSIHVRWSGDDPIALIHDKFFDRTVLMFCSGLFNFGRSSGIVTNRHVDAFFSEG